jgi:hypothetical protein
MDTYAYCRCYSAMLYYITALLNMHAPLVCTCISLSIDCTFIGPSLVNSVVVCSGAKHMFNPLGDVLSLTLTLQV